MPLELLCTCTGRYIRHTVEGSVCSKCNSSAVLESPKALQYRQLDYSYECPITGAPIQSKAAHNYNLELHGKHVLERGELEDAKKVRAQIEADFENKLCETAAQLVHDLPEPMKAALEQELLTTNTQISRGTL